ncbi:MAG: hypothetical protein PW999_16815 [Paraburkholderia tropica]|nr:hypothetical protein [Paraburkholderia tropica]
MPSIAYFIASSDANARPTPSSIARDAQRAAAMAPSDRAALDVAGEALSRVTDSLIWRLTVRELLPLDPDQRTQRERAPTQLGHAYTLSGMDAARVDEFDCKEGVARDGFEVFRSDSRRANIRPFAG